MSRAFLMALSMALIACGGGSGGNPTVVEPTPTATASPTPTAAPTPVAKLAICPNDFALCSASTCVATGGEITLNDGRTLPAASCTCPVLPGPSIADLNAGNMQGSCTPPKDGVWSTYQINGAFPQAAANPTWSEASAVALICPGGREFAQCWNFACQLGPVVNGVQLAQCTCPIELALTPFVSQAGLGGEDSCTKLPISAALAVDPNSLP
jgi:hypothetical protein